MNNNINKKIDKYIGQRQTANFTPAIKFMGGIIYILGLIYAGSHVYSFVSSIMTVEFLRIMAYLGGTGIILNGAILPLAIHSWTMEKTHRITAVFFYALDLVLIAGFVWANTNIARGNNMAMVEQYMTWVSPLTFMNTILTWGILTILDPENKLKYQIASLEQQAEIVSIKSDMLLLINQAEQEAEQKFANAGFLLDDKTQSYQPAPRRMKVSRPPEMPNFQEDYDQILADFHLPETEPEMPTPNQNHSGNHSGYSPKA